MIKKIILTLRSSVSTEKKIFLWDLNKSNNIMDSPLGDKRGLEPFTGLLSSIFDNFENFFEEHKNELDLEKIF